MKKLILLVLSLVLCFCMVNIVLAVTTPSDVVGTKYETAVKTLVESNVINGYEDGTYRPSENVTRAQLAKIICEALHLENVEEGVTFSDVAPEHWATSYIKIASKNNIITGYVDGTFKPEANVTYAEAVTMIMRATGNDVGVSSTGKWYDNYMSKAKEKNLLNNITGVTEDQNLNRGDTALLTYNMLQSGNGTGNQEGELVDVDNLNEYNGTYTHENNTICLYRTSLDSFEFIYKTTSGVDEEEYEYIDSMGTLSIENGSKLVYTSGEEKIEIQLTKDGIRFVSSSPEDSMTSYYNGEYMRADFDSSNWDGVYKNENSDSTIVIAETSKGNMRFSMNLVDDITTFLITDYTDTEIDSEILFDETIKIKVVKSDEGIVIEQLSIKKKDLKGEYKKVND